MLIHSLDVAVSEDDLNRFISRHTPTGGKIADIRIALEDQHLIFSGRVTLLLAVHVEVAFLISHTATQITAHLAHIRPLSALTAQFKNKLLAKIIDILPFAKLDAEKNTIRIFINDLAAFFGVTSNLYIQDLTITEKLLTLKLGGSIDL